MARPLAAFYIVYANIPQQTLTKKVMRIYGNFVNLQIQYRMHAYA